MAGAGVQVEEFDGADREHRLLPEVHQAVAAAERAVLPDDEPIPYGELVDDLSYRVPTRRTRHWVARAGGRVAGLAELRLDLVDNVDLGWAKVVVHPELRRRGAGTALLGAMVEVMDAEARRLLGVFVRREPAAVSFLAGLGFEERLVERQSRLVVADLDVAMLHAWVARAAERAGGYALQAWDGDTPPDLLEAFAEAQGIMNSAPRDGLDMADETMTPAQLVAQEAAFHAAGRRWWTVAAVEAATGRIAGFTELFFTPWRDHLAFQGNTGVDPAHRNRGLGRWLKAAMLLRLLEEKPAVRHVDTYNAASNDAMLAINVALGFRPLLAWSDWQAPVGRLAGRLGARAGAGLPGA